MSEADNVMKIVPIVEDWILTMQIQYSKKIFVGFAKKDASNQ